VAGEGRGDGEVRWNPQTQSWDTGAPRGPYTPPPPPRPGFEPTPAPGFEPAPAPGEGGRRPANRVVAVLAAAVLIGAGAGFGGWFLWGRDGTRADARPPAEAGVAPTTSGTGGSADPSQSVQGTSEAPAPSASPPPPGYRTVSEGEFDILVPEDWEPDPVSGKAGVTVYYYREPGDGPRYVQVFRVSEPGATPVSTLTAAEKELRSRAPEFRRNSREPVAGPRGEAAELDYSSRSGDGATELRTLDRVFPAGAGQLYTVLVSGPAAEWPKQREIMEEAVASFCLSGQCRGSEPPQVP